MLAQELGDTKRDLDVLLKLLDKACDPGFAQTATSAWPTSKPTERQEHQNAAMMARELADTKRDLDVLLKFLNRACNPSAHVGQTADEGVVLRNSLLQERERAVRLEQDLAATRRDLETQTALASKAAAEANRLKTADAESADLQKSPQRDRASRLEQDLAAARHDVETQTALAAKIQTEASELKKRTDAGSADLQKSLQQEHDRVSGLERDLAAARRDVELQTALASKAGEEATQLRQAEERDSTELKRSLQKEHERAEGLAKDLSMTHTAIYAYEAQAREATDQGAQLKKAAESGTTDLQKSLQQEHDRASGLERDLAAARRDVETQTALAAKIQTEASELKKRTDAGSADLQKSLQQEHDRASGLERDLAAARRDVELQTALASKAGEEATQLRQAEERNSTELKRSLQKEHERAEGLAKDLSMAHTAIYAYEAQARQASDQGAQLKKAPESGTADLQKSLQQEHDRASGLERDLAAARRDVEAQTALATRAGKEAAQLRQAVEGSTGEVRKWLVQEWEREARLQQQLPASRRGAETQGEETNPRKKAAHRGSAQKSHQQERELASRYRRRPRPPGIFELFLR
jgi:septal ring factor EnvC (AmiA/AmiB activator)